MFSRETQILQQLAVLVVCHDVAAGQTIQTYFLVQKLMSWIEAREFCRSHYVDLAVLSTEEQYFTLLNATAANKDIFWLGLERKSSWKWLNGERLSYDRWYRENNWCGCASLEAMLKTDRKLLARYCDEPHRSICQGPDSLQAVTVDSVGSDHVILSWNVSAFMQMTPHSYNVTTCTDTCNTLIYPYTNGSVLMNINISNLMSATEYFIEISTFVVRSGGNMTLQSDPTTLQVRTDAATRYNVIIVILKSLKLVSLAPPLWILYRILKKSKSPSLSKIEESDRNISLVESSTESTTVTLIPPKTRGFG